MTTEQNGNPNPDHLQDEIVQTLSELPDDILGILHDLPEEFVNRLCELPPESRTNLTRLPIDLLSGLSALPAPVLEWLGRLCISGRDGVDAQALTQFIGLAKDQAAPLAQLKHVPTDMIHALSLLPPEVVDCLFELPPALLRQLPAALAGDDTAESSATISEVSPDLMASLSDLPSDAAASLANLPVSSLASLASIDPEVLATVADLPADLVRTMTRMSGGALSTVLEAPTDAGETLSEIDAGVLARIAEQPTQEKPAIPETLFFRLGQLESPDSGTLGRLVDQARTLKGSQIPGEPPEVDGEVGAEATMADISGDSAEGDSADVGNVNQQMLSDEWFEGLSSPDGVKPTDAAAADDDDSFSETVQDSWEDDSDSSQTVMSDDLSFDELTGEGLTADSLAGGGRQTPTDADDDSVDAGAPAMASDDWSTEGLSAFDENVPGRGKAAADDDDSFGETVQPEDFQKNDGHTQAEDDDDDSFSQTVASDDWSSDGLSADGLSAFDQPSGESSQEDSSQTFPSDQWPETGSDSVDEDDGSFDQTMQIDEGTFTGGMTAQPMDEDDESFDQTVQIDEDSASGGMMTSQFTDDDDESFDQTVQIDDSSAGGMSANFTDDDDDSFTQTVQTDDSFGGMTAQFDGDDDSFNETVQTDGSIGGVDEDSFSQTIQSDSNSADSFMQTMANSGLEPKEQKTLADAWGSDVADGGRPKGKKKVLDLAKKTGTETLVISERKLSTRHIKDYNKGRRPPEPVEPEYELLKKLGEGGMGVVYTARQTSINREVALKMLKAKTAKDKEQQGKFLSEAVVTGDLAHPNIVPIYDVGRGADQALFYAMKKVEGLPWQDVLKEEFECMGFETLDELGASPRDLRKVRNGDKQLEECEWYEHGRTWALPYLFPNCSDSQLKRLVDANQNIRQVMEEMNIPAPTEPQIELARRELRSEYREKQLGILARCADAIAFAHARGVIHRDLKPENIMLGAFNEVLVMDWGLAFSTSEFRKSGSITESTSMGGTPAYMAPEMATGPIARIGPTSDIYLLGAMLFEVISGKPPHAGKNAMKCLMSAARNQIREVDQEEVQRNDPTGELMEIALKSMETKPEDRYQTVEEMQAALREHDSHTESVTLTVSAFEDLAEAKVDQDYDQFSRARFGFEQAISMWGANRNAKTGLQETRFEYAKCAKDHGDFDLGLGLLDISVPEHKTLHDELVAAKAEIEARERELELQKKATEEAERQSERRRKLMIKGGAVALMIVSVMAVVAVWQAGVAVAQRKIAQQNEAEAVKQKGIAVEQTEIAQANFEEAEKQRLIADEQRGIAVENLDEAKRQKVIADEQRMVAEKNEAEALKQKGIAETNLMEADKQRKIALANFEEAEKQRLIAETNEKKAITNEALAKKNAIEARKQEKIAIANAEEAKKQEEKAIASAKEATRQQLIAVANADEANRQRGIAEEQRIIAVANEQEAKRQERIAIANAYIAQIGLADAKIRENEFDSAREILEGVRTKSPDLLDWEWGRLMHLCTQSIGTFDNMSPVDSIELSPDGSQFVTGGWNGTAVVWDYETGKADMRLVHDGPRVHSVAWSSDGNWIATGSDDADNGYVQLWNAKTGERVERSFGDAFNAATAHTDAVLSVRFSKDASRLLTASYDGTARVWDVATGRQIHRLTGHSNWVWDAAFSPDEQWIVTASQDGTAMVWDAVTGTPTAPFTGHDGAVYSATFGPDSLMIATGGYDRRVMVWKRTDVKPYRFDKLNTDNGRVEAPQKFRAFDGHDGPIRSVRFSNDGQRIVSGSMDNTIGLWDVEGGQLLMQFRGHDGAIRDVTFDTEDRVILSASQDHHIKKWDIDEYEEIRVLQSQLLSGHTNSILSAEFSASGERVVTASQDSTARIWDVATGDELDELSEGHSFLVSTAVLFPKRRRMATGAADNTARIWDMNEGRQLQTLKGTGRAAAMAVTGDGKWLITGSDGRDIDGNDDESSVKIWDTETGKLLYSLSGHVSEVTAVAVSTDSSLLVSGDSRGRVKLWDLKTRKELFALSGHTVGRRITGAAFLPGTRRVLTASADQSVAQWDTQTGKELLPLILKHPDAVVGLVIRPGTHHVLTACADGKARLWDADAGGEALSTYDVESPVDSVSIDSTGGTALAVDGQNQKIHLWTINADATAIEPLPTLPIDGRLSAAIFAPTPRNEGLLVLGGSDARLVSLNNSETLATFQPHGGVASANFSPDGNRVVTGSRDAVARVWDTRSGADLKKFSGENGHSESVNSAVFSPDADGQFVLTASDDGTVKVWNAETGEMLETMAGHTGAVNSAVFSPEGSMVLSASIDGTARLWSLETGEELVAYEGHTGQVLAARFSDDGRYVVTAGADVTARVWNRETGEPVAVLSGHTADVNSAAFSPGENPSRVVTASKDGTVKLWDLETEKEILTLDGHTREVTSVAFSPDGRSVLTSSQDGRAILWLTADWKVQEEPRVAAAGDGE